MTPTATPNVVAGLASRLTDSQDRETYSALVSYVNELPPGDEFRQLMEMLGLLSLMGQRIPIAVAELLTELRAQTVTTAAYHAKVDMCLASLPSEIAAGVDVAVVANAMSEAFRQQLAATGLQDTSAVLKTAIITIKQLSGELTATLKPAAGEYKSLASMLSNEIAKLVRAARKVEEHNDRLIALERSNRWGLSALGALVVFLLGGVTGIELDRQQTKGLMSNIGARIAPVQMPTLPVVQIPRKDKGKAHEASH